MASALITVHVAASSEFAEQNFQALPGRATTLMDAPRASVSPAWTSSGTLPAGVAVISMRSASEVAFE